jgi:hypothetical protein
MNAWWFRSIYWLLFIMSLAWIAAAGWAAARLQGFAVMLFLCCAAACWPNRWRDSKPLFFRHIEGIPVMVDWDGQNQVYSAKANDQVIIAYDPYELPGRVRRANLRQLEIEIARNAVNKVLESL